MVERQPLINYNFHPFGEISEEVLDFVALMNNSVEEDKLGLFGAQMKEVGVILEAVKNDADRFQLAKFEIGAINLLEVGLLHELKDLLINSAKYEDMSSKLEKLRYEVDMISVVLGIQQGDTLSYSMEEIRKISFVAGGKYDFARILRTLVDGINGEDGKEITMVLFSKFDWLFLNENEGISWSEAMILMLLTNSIFVHFVQFSDELRTEVLRKCFYRGIVFGAPVRKAIEDALYETNHVVSYVFLNKFLFDALLLNMETVPSAGRSFNVVFHDYLNQTGNAWYDGNRITEYVRAVYKEDPDKNFLEVWMTEALSIGVHIRAADLIKSNVGHELFADEKYYNEVIKLIGLFAAGEAGAKDLVDYFKQDKPIVRLVYFLEVLNSVADLNKEVTLNNCLEFSKNLQANGLWPEDNDLVYFDEKSGKFYWSKIR